MERKQMRGDRERVLDHILHATTTTAMTANDLKVNCDSTGGAFTLTLPSVVEAMGRIYTVRLTAGAVNAVTLTHKSDSVDWAANFTLDANNDAIALYSDGEKWYAIDNEIA